MNSTPESSSAFWIAAMLLGIGVAQAIRGCIAACPKANTGKAK
jgi:hypothetical protein